MNKLYYFLLAILSLFACNEREPDVIPLGENYPFRLVLDTDEGGDLPDAEDYGLEIGFADYLGDLPATTLVLSYEITDLSGDFMGLVEIDKVVYTYEDDDCEYERELNFDASTITVSVDTDLGTVPDAFEVEFTLPGLDNTEGGFVFTITSIQTTAPVLLNETMTFEYEVLENDLAGDWVLELDEATFLELQDNFSILSPDLADAAFGEIEPVLVAEFEFGEMKFEIELLETEAVCEEGETEEEAKTIEIEADYDAEEGELVLEGSYLIIDDGLESGELDYVLEAEYILLDDGETLQITFTKLIDEDQYEAGDELYTGSFTLTFIKD